MKHKIVKPIRSCLKTKTPTGEHANTMLIFIAEDGSGGVSEIEESNLIDWEHK